MSKSRVAKYSKRFLIFIYIICLINLVLPLNYLRANAETSYLISVNRPCYASSVNGSDTPERATDGDLGTYWQAAWNIDNQWIDVDIGKTAQINKIVFKWQSELSYAKRYKIQVSDDEINWQTVYVNENGTGGVQVTGQNGMVYYEEEITISATGRYVRMFAEKSASGYGVALREFEVYGYGGVVSPPTQAVNLALGKSCSASSTATPWWAQPGQLDPNKAVDGDKSTYWQSKEGNDQWFQVDLGNIYTIGKVNIIWGEGEFGRIYDIQVSTDGINWETVYRQIYGNGDPESIPVYAVCRYVRMKGIAMGRGGGYSIKEFEVYQYVPGDPQIRHQIPSLPSKQIVSVGKGSYLIDDVNCAQPRYPKYVTKNIKTPIPSNDWWTSVIYKRLSDGMPALPLVYWYFDNGLGFYYASDLFTAPNNGGMDTKCRNMDLFVNTSSIIGTPSAKLDGYGDWSVTVVFSDDDTPKMRSTLVKGSPYVYNTFTDPNSVEVWSPSLVCIFDENGNPILTNDGDSITTDHIGVEVTNVNTAPEPKTLVRSYGIFAPPGTVFTRVGSKIKIKLGSGENYLVIGLLPERKNLNYLYQHAYAFVIDTTVSYRFDQSTSTVYTTFTDKVVLKRQGFSSQTLMALFPTQWKYTNASFAPVTYNSARGLMKVIEGNSFTTQLKFYGITPSFGEPIESNTYSREKMKEYLNAFKESVSRDYWVADPYWQGKKTHPLAMGILIAEQIGDYETRDLFISILRKILINWLTYDGNDDYPYYTYYSSSWGTLNGDGGDHGMAINLSDHHFLWGYFIFPAAVLASYDKNFVRDYGGMIEHMIRDCMNPSKTDSMYPYMRNFDPYESHSWAGGYGDNQSGNNQESTSEATFAWAGLYLWGLVTGNDTYRDAGIWGFTSEVNAIEQYWFNYDQDNWAEDYASGAVGILWGTAYTNGTYFSANPCCIYGIHWLPVTPVLTYLGYKPEIAARIYSMFRNDLEKYVANNPNDPEGWFHITWAYQSLFDPEGVMNKWDDSKLPDDERFNTYWFVQNMSAKGYRSTEIWSNNWTCYQVFKKDGKYSAVVWNPLDSVQYVEFCNKDGVVGSVYVPPHVTVVVNPLVHNGMAQVTIPPAPAPDPAPHAVPGLIEAEDYYTNFSCSKVPCSEGGYAIGYIDNGDKLVYEVNVEEEGDYTVQYRIINRSSNPGVIFLKSDLAIDQILAMTEVPISNDWTTIASDVHLKAGTQKIILYFNKGGFDLNWIKFTKKALSQNLALNKAVTASSTQAGLDVKSAVDGNVNTRWGSDWSDPQWISVDLGSVYSVSKVVLRWETAYGKSYKIQVSTDGMNWTDVYSTTAGDGGVDEIVFSPVNARYVRMYGTERGTGWGYSLWEFEVYGGAAVQDTTGGGNLALNKAVTASSTQAGLDVKSAVDGNVNTRWGSDWSDPQWISVDLGSVYSVSKVVLRWETAYGKSYKIQVSTDGMNWTDVYSTTAGDGGVDEIVFSPVNARYVRMYGTERGTGWGYSLWEFEVYGGAAVQDTTSGGNLALNKAVTASSTQAGLDVKSAVDGNVNTRWGSDWSDPQWISVDLGSVYSVSKVVLRWETAYGKSYKIQVSTDGMNWTDVYSTTAGDGGVDEIVFSPVNARYVRMYGTERGTGWGYSLWEFEVY
ncbi:coagulation factor 5/8 type domain protein [Caldicellulosiruptor kronotskyensis 2002]|uniref:glucan endo-1,3-beta-D-glucosidase n=1 Tax=Caldicellulosiruptor kronotskyensis (strain DSM 18902 / VKM B-2412 / 2002) TaxID=632348 RepID=E4SCP7_CALK2|nr:discoidin domain-containing protein [Caldicellulosiruptor kronotskyensis]ADQ45030.1 coagulation factor 5/8 type domain protein [Caldicellulosiruptor kronotskyensis 2002]